jgi:N-acetylglucosamine-6-phosphate deacetylase
MRIIAMLPNGRGGLLRSLIAVSSGRITDVSPLRGDEAAPDSDFDFGSYVAMPGFIDLQVNGAFGSDITNDPPAMWPIGERLLSHGVTAFLPTIVTCSPQQRHSAYRAIKNRPAGYVGAVPVGLHLEGPALSPVSAGTHSRARLVADAGDLAAEFLAEADTVALVTIAPETANATGLTAHLVEANIAVSLGHTSATAAQALEAVEAGASAFTHLFNGMGPLHHREVGAVGAALLHPTCWLMLIVDGHHLADDAVRLAWRLAGPERICLVTDAMAGMGATPGTYRIGEVRVQCGDQACNADGGLAGSLLTMPDAARRFRRITGATWDDLAKVTSVNQADLLGLSDRGRIAPGQMADFAIVDAGLNLIATIVMGEVAYQRQESVTARFGPGYYLGPDKGDIKPSHRAAADTGGLGGATVIGVDIGGTTFKAATFDGARLGDVRSGPTGNSRSASSVLAEIRVAIDDLASTTDYGIRAVGIACAGIVDAAAGKVVRALNLGWSDVDVIAAVRRGLKVPVVVEHDVYAAALAEWHTGAGVGAESMLYVSIGTGIAVRFFTSAGTARGSTGLAGEMGFMPVGSDNHLLESVASGRAIRDSYYRETGQHLTAAQIIAAVPDDPAADRVWNEATDSLAQGIVASVCLLDPQIVVIGGGVSNARAELFSALSPRITALLKPLREPPPMASAVHGALSGVIGAALHADLSTISH